MILIGALAIAAGVGVWYYKTKFYVPDKGGMERDFSDTGVSDTKPNVGSEYGALCNTITSCRYYTGGGMEGGSTSIELFTGEDKKIYLSYYDCPYIGAEEVSYTIEVGSDALDEIKKAFCGCNFLSWGKLEQSDLMILDAPRTTISVIYGDGEMYSVSCFDELPKEGYNIFSKIYSILEMFLKGDD